MFANANIITREQSLQVLLKWIEKVRPKVQVKGFFLANKEENFTTIGLVAQLVEHSPCTGEVGGSIPSEST